jgi:hypothetical protein
MKKLISLTLIVILFYSFISCSSDSEENKTEQKSNREIIIGNWVVANYIFEFPEDNENFEVCGDYSFLANGTYTYVDCQDNSEEGLYNILSGVLTLNSNVGSEVMEIIELKENRAELKATRSHSGSEVEGTIILER